MTVHAHDTYQFPSFSTHPRSQVRSRMPLSDRSGGSVGSGKSTPNVPRRPKSPVAMYQMDYGFGAPKPARPLIKLEPKAPKPRSGQNTISSPSSRSISSHGSHSMSITSFATTSSSSSSGSKSRPSMSLPRLFDKLRKPHTPSSYPQSPDTPASLSPPFKAETILDSATHKSLPVVPVAEALDDNEIVEELREPQPDRAIQTNSRRSSLTLSSIQDYYVSPEQGLVASRKTGSFRPPPRPPRDPKRPKTAPSQRPLPLLPERPSIPTFRPFTRDSSLDETLEFQRPVDMTRVDSPSSLTHSKSVSHSMMTAAVRPDSPFVDTVPIQSYFAGAVGPKEATTSSSTAARRERRQGWSGEWNVNDMRDVIQKLRELK